MPWYDFPNLRKNILTGRFSSNQAWSFLVPVISFLRNSLHTNIIDRSPSLDWFVSSHVDRVLFRLNDVAHKSPSLNSLISSDTIQINGINHFNLLQALKIIFSKVEFLKSLAPDQLCMVHGDFHFQNILCGNPYNSSGFCWLIHEGSLPDPIFL